MPWKTIQQIGPPPLPCAVSVGRLLWAHKVLSCEFPEGNQRGKEQDARISGGDTLPKGAELI
jgi:hypothetical protein